MNDLKPNFDNFNGSDRGDYLAVVIHSETKEYHGAYFMNKPTPSGCDRFMIQWSTQSGYKTKEEAAKAIEDIFPAMPKVKPEEVKDVR